MNKRFYWLVIAFLSLLISVSTFYIKSATCFDDEGIEICYDHKSLLPGGGAYNEIYKEFLERLKSNGEPLGIEYSKEILRHDGNKADDKMRKNFSWIREGSVYRVIEGSEYVAILLKEGVEKGVLYYSKANKNIVVGFDVGEEFIPINIGWVNEGYKHTREKLYFDVPFPEGPCSFRMRAVKAYLSHETIEAEGDYVVCSFMGFKVKIDGGNVSEPQFVSSSDGPGFVELSRTASFVRFMAKK